MREIAAAIILLFFYYDAAGVVITAAAFDFAGLLSGSAVEFLENFGLPRTPGRDGPWCELDRGACRGRLRLCDRGRLFR